MTFSVGESLRSFPYPQGIARPLARLVALFLGALALAGCASSSSRATQFSALKAEDEGCASKAAQETGYKPVRDQYPVLTTIAAWPLAPAAPYLHEKNAEAFQKFLPAYEKCRSENEGPRSPSE